ncbi:hypothetical protein N7509_013550 [Penicillium cosmopolitanum]|uniref:Uncharacterized protein n=1 Tax=Penicillium cosmopolitanum TaxID=1131564 RepID=A0A9W9SFI2_9EURO|nr:uncharacterized protein N7509_013550 [Penicillium cosmopolitanum]KAJ5376664.1 hypothetical protein N7509_013550 [Penicillium cosmopolitanum]
MTLTSLLSVMATMATTVIATALTTPFVQPSGCTSAVELTTITTSVLGTPTTITVLASDAAAPGFSSCQPSGWNTGAKDEDLFTFSPAVCPQNWTYYEMSSTKHYSAAYCCARYGDSVPLTSLTPSPIYLLSHVTNHCSGFAFEAGGYALPTSALSPACGRTINSGETTITAPLASRTDATGTFTQGMIVHRAWHVTWAESDTATMSPSLPPLTSGKYLAVWKPGQGVPDGAFDHHNGDNSGVRGWNSLLYFAMIGVPIIGVAILACGGWLCIRRRRKRRAGQAAGI